ncbi:hypothetical protein CPC08DRAFT_709818 [Agrocybe pediades]|nr:hypothetical protein CPC08DRAFT_709818 [Agrocybe pediades]
MADKDPSRRAEQQHQRAPSLNSRQPYPESRAPSQEQSNGQSNGAVHLRTLHPVYPDNRIPPPPGAQYVQVHGRRPSIPSMPPEGHGPIPSSVAPFIDPNGSRRPVHLSARQASAPSLIIPAVQPSQRLHFQYDSPTYSLPTPPATAQQQQQQQPQQQQQQPQQQQNARPLPPQAPMHTLAPAPAPAHAGPSRTMESIVDHALVPVRARLEDVLQATKETLHENLMKIREDYGVYLNDMQTRHERATQATLEKKEAGYKLAVEEVNRLQREVAELRKARDNDAHIIEGYRRRDSEKELNDGHSMVLLAAKYIDELSEEYKKVFREKERLRREITNGTPGSTSSALGDDDILKSFSDERDRSRLQKLRHILRLAESQQNGGRPSSSNPHSRRPSMSSPQLLANVPALSRNGQSPFVNGDSAPKERERLRSSTYSPAIWKPAPPEENAHIRPQHSPIDGNSPHEFSTAPSRPSVGRSASTSRILLRHSPIDDDSSPRDFSTRPGAVVRSASSILSQHSPMDENPPPPREFNTRPFPGVRPGSSSSRSNSSPAVPHQTYRDTPIIPGSMPPPLSTHPRDSRKRPRESSLEIGGASTPVDERPAIRIKTEERQPSESLVLASPSPMQVDSNVKLESRPAQLEKEDPWTREARGLAHDQQPQPHERRREASREGERRHGYDERTEPPPPREVRGPAPEPQPHAHERHREASREEEERRLSRHDERKQPPPPSEVPRSASAPTAASTPVQPQPQPQPPAAAATAPPPPPPSQASAPAPPPPPPAHAPMQPTQPPAQMPAYYRSDVYKPVPEIQRLAYRRPSGGSSSYFPPPPRAPPPVFAASSEPPPPAGPPKLGLKHLDLMYKQDNAGYTCQYCINRARNRSPTSSPGKAPPTPIAKFPKTAPMQDLMNHSLKEHPQECDNLLKLNHTQITERKQRMRAGGM